MKKIVFVLVLTLGWLLSLAQREPILERGGNYEPQKVKEFALSSTTKANSFRENLVFLVNKKLQEAGIQERIINKDDDIKMVFDSTQIDEVTLAAGIFKNSYWDVQSQNVLFGKLSLTGYSGFAGITRLYGVTFVLYKYDCVNLLDAPVLYIKINKITPSVPAPAPKPKVDDYVDNYTDTIRKKIVEENYYTTNVYEDDIYYRPEPRREIYWQVRLRMDGGSYGPPMLVDNRTFINNYQNNDNYYCEKTNSRPPVVKDPPHASGPDEGRDDDGNASGPGGRGDNGGNASGPGGSANGNNNTTGSGGRSASTRSQNQKFDHSNDMVLKSASSGRTRSSSSFDRPKQSSYSGGTNKRQTSSYSSNASYSGGNRQASLASSSRRNPSYGGASRANVNRSSSYGASRGSSTRRR